MSGLIPTYRGCVNIWECDQMGHMNVQFYLHKAGDATAFLSMALGLGPRAVRERRLMLMSVEDRVQFKRELRVGDVFTMASGVRKVENDMVATFTELRNTETGRTATSFERRLACYDLETRRFRPLPDDVRHAAERLAAGWNGLPAAPQPQGDPAPPPGTPGLIETNRSAISPWETDQNGHAEYRIHILRFSNAMLHFIGHLGLTEQDRVERNWGLAVLDYHLHYRRPLERNELLLIRSGIIEVRDKVIRLFHHMVHGRTGEPLTSIEVVVAMFDLGTRKSFNVPDHIRDHALALRAATG